MPRLVDGQHVGRQAQVVPGQVVPTSDRRVDVEAEPRLARPLLDDEEPARVVVRLRRVAAARLLGGQVEAEEVDVGVDLAS